MSSLSKPKFCFIFKFEIRHSTPSLSLFNSIFRSANKLWRDFIFHWPELPGSWTARFKDTEKRSRGYRIEQQKNLNFQGEDNHETKIIERESKTLKNNWFKHELKVTFLRNFSHLSEKHDTLEENCWGKHLRLVTLREGVREAHTILAHCLTDSLFSEGP